MNDEQVARHHARIVTLEGGGNVRDLGGLPLGAGKQFAANQLYRASALCELTPLGKSQFAELGLASVIDLREEYELAIMDTRWMHDTPSAVLHIPSAVPRERSNTVAGEKFIAKASAHAMRARKADGYRTKPQELSAATRAMFECLADPSRSPVLVHCAGGADRTGVICAVLLMWLGADWQTALEDYLFTNVQKRELEATDGPLSDQRRILAAYGFKDAPDTLLDAVSHLREEYLAAAFEAIEDRHGGLERYLEETCAIDEATLDSVRERLSVAPSLPAA
ncbi:MAG: tyrosine-protein phosphatase [Pseudomonadota bacterium]